MKAVRLTRANGLNERVQGDAGAIRFLDDEEAYDLVEMHRMAVYAPEHDAEALKAAALAGVLETVQADASFVGPERAAERMQELVELTEEMGLYEDQQPVYEEVNAQHPLPELDGELSEREDLAGFGEDPVPLEMPRASDSKAAWIDWAVKGDHGQEPCSPKMAALLTKPQIMSRYGERL